MMSDVSDDDDDDEEEPNSDYSQSFHDEEDIADRWNGAAVDDANAILMCTQKKRLSMELIESRLEMLRNEEYLPRVSSTHSLPNASRSHDSSGHGEGDEGHHHPHSRKDRHSMSYLYDDNHYGHSSSPNSSGNPLDHSGEFHRAAFEFEQGMRANRDQRVFQWWRKQLAVFMLIVAVVVAGAIVWGPVLVASASNGSTSVAAGSTLQEGHPEPEPNSRNGMVDHNAKASGAATGPSTDPNDIKRRILVLEHVIEIGLLPQHGHGHEFDLTSNGAQMAMKWMAGTDAHSMVLLDEYHYHHGGNHHLRHRHVRQLQHHPSSQQQPHEPMPQGFGPHVSHHVDMDMTAAHLEEQILERYVEATVYFEHHPRASIHTTVLN